jgi:hypothetical protein
VDWPQGRKEKVSGSDREPNEKRACVQTSFQRKSGFSPFAEKTPLFSAKGVSTP